MGIPTDVGNADSVKKAFKSIDEKFGADASCAVRPFST